MQLKMNSDLIIDIYTLCWNEEKIIPFVIDYWKHINPRSIHVYDNESTDNSIKLLKEYDKVKIHTYNSNGTIHDGIYLDIKNNCWKESDADFVIVCDMDECVYSDHLHDILHYMKENNQTISYTAFLTTISTYEQPYQPDKLYHEYKDTRFILPFNIKDKALIFSPKKIQEIDYEVGAHTCNPAGRVNYYDKQETDPIQTIHIKDLSLNYKLTRYHTYLRRLSEYNRKNFLGIHYMYSGQKQVYDYYNGLYSSKKYNDIINEIRKDENNNSNDVM